MKLSKQIFDKVDKNIYDLTYLTDLSEDSKNEIAQNMMEHIDKINKFFEIKLIQFANNDNAAAAVADIDSNQSDINFLGKKRLGFMERNNFQFNENENSLKKQKLNNNNKKAQKDSAFLKYSDSAEPNEKIADEKCFEPKGVRYTISNLNFRSSTQFDFEQQQSAESAFEELKFDAAASDYENDSNEAQSAQKASKKYFKYSTESSANNIRNFKYENLPKASNSTSLMVKRNFNSNNKDVISLPYIENSNNYNNLNNNFNNFGLNDNVNSLYCKDFMSLADENSEFFRRIFAKLDLQKKADILREQLDLNGNVYEDVNKSERQEKISFNQKK